MENVFKLNFNFSRLEFHWTNYNNKLIIKIGKENIILLKYSHIRF